MKESESAIGPLEATFVYDPTTGDILWLRDGRRAGYTDWQRGGYRLLRFRGVNYRQHRLAFALKEGRWPKGVVDHINNERDDNRWANLREATISQNNANIWQSPRSGTRGVRRKGKKWEARIHVGGKTKHLGTFASEESASMAYVAAAKARHGDFIRIQPNFMD